MTPEARRLLSSTIRALRARLVGDLHTAMTTEYRLGVARPRDSGLTEAAARKRAHLENWLDDQLQAQAHTGQPARTREALRLELAQQAAYTLLHRLVVLRLMEAAGLRREPLVTHGWESAAYRTFRALAPALVQGDASEGYALLLRLVCEELAADLPGLFEPQGVDALVPVPASTLRHAVEALDHPGLASCWTDDMTLGWVYQSWNDPEREALDVRLNARGKLAPHEVASKTQLFTERYMVDWLLQNTLGPIWLTICAQHGWTPEARATLAALAARRLAWRDRRERGEVALTELMPLHTDAERRWAYYVPQPALAHAAASVRELRVLDPAVGSGHFLLVAFDLLFALYQEEARHRGEAGAERWSPRAIAEHILEHNLHGVDLDPRAVQIAAAALWLKARRTCPEAQPRSLGLVATDLRLSGLPGDDPALVELRRALGRDTGMPGALVDTIIAALKGADHVGSLLRIDHAVEQALATHAHAAASIDPMRAKTTILERLAGLLQRHTHGDDLGLRLRGEQLAAGVRLLRVLREDQYDLVVGNPPYQGTSRMADAAYIQTTYPRGKADLYAAFLERGLQLARPGGLSALLTMRNWMFIKQFAELRQWLLQRHDLRALGDFDRGAFEQVPDELVSVVASIFQRSPPRAGESVALQPTPPDDRSRDNERTRRKHAATLAQVGRIEFSVHALAVVPERPLVYGWDDSQLSAYGSAPLIGAVSPARKGLCTGDDVRHTRAVWEVSPARRAWAPVIKGGKGRQWIEPLSDVVRWERAGLVYRLLVEMGTGTRFQNSALFFRPGVAFAMIGPDFAARIHRYPGVFGDMGSSVFPDDRAQTLCSMNSGRSRRILRSLNPGMHFQVGDVNRLPLFPIADADQIFATLERSFTEHESHREPSVEFRRPGPSPWRHAQEWAQAAVDRPEGAPLPAHEPEHDPEPATDHLSFALGVALGRFGPAGEGTRDPAKDSLAHALPAGILFLDGTLDPEDRRDSLGHAAARPLHSAFDEHGAAAAPGRALRTYLARNFFEVHRRMYENRPIHWPLSSREKTFVAWISIHRWHADTLRVLLADHLHPTRTRIDGALADLRAARDGLDRTASRAAEKRVGSLQRARDELEGFIAAVEQCAERGPPPTDPRQPEREVNARYAPELDDGVMVNAAALWPLLAPQWKDPTKWWMELAAAEGKLDWSLLAMRYWPRRVDARCRQDPSLALAHGCLHKYHPARARAWELRLQDELGPEFRIDEASCRGDGGHEAA